MKAVMRLSAGVVAVAVIGLLALPILLVGVVTERLQRASALAAQWDIPPELMPVFQEAGQAAGVPWALLAGGASVATDFGRHGPDGAARGATAGTAIFPALLPALVMARAGPACSWPRGGRRT